MKNTLKIPVLAGLIVAGGLALNARASLPDSSEVQAMIDESDLIVTGRVQEIEQPGDGTTRIILKVKDILKGATPDGTTIQIVVPGGAMQGSAVPLVVKNQPVFLQKERVIVFLSINGDHFEVDRAQEGKQPGEGADAKNLQDQVRRYLSEKHVF